MGIRGSVLGLAARLLALLQPHSYPAASSCQPSVAVSLDPLDTLIEPAELLDLELPVKDVSWIQGLRDRSSSSTVDTSPPQVRHNARGSFFA
jgi:hypothetical protein